MKKWVWVILLGWIAVFIIVFSTIYPIKYKSIVLRYSNEFGLTPDLVFAVINAESGFDKTAKSGAGAVGLMQVLPSTASEVGSKLNMAEVDLFSPDDNVRVGCYYLRFLLDKYEGDEVLALASYNAGYNNVNHWVENGFDGKAGNIPVEQTKYYVKKIIRYKKIYKILCH